MRGRRRPAGRGALSSQGRKGAVSGPGRVRRRQRPGRTCTRAGPPRHPVGLCRARGRPLRRGQGRRGPCRTRSAGYGSCRRIRPASARGPSPPTSRSRAIRTSGPTGSPRSASASGELPRSNWRGRARSSPGWWGCTAGSRPRSLPNQGPLRPRCWPASARSTRWSGPTRGLPSNRRWRRHGRTGGSLVVGRAKHSFSNPGADRLGWDAVAYDPAADTLSWRLAEHFLSEALLPVTGDARDDRADAALHDDTSQG